MVPKKMLFQSQWQLFKFESLKETGSFSGFLCSEFSSLLCFRFKEGKKKPQPCLSGFRHIWEFTASSRCPLPEDVYGTIFLRSQEHRAWPFSLPPPPALQHQVTTTTWRCSAVENPHSDFLVLVGSSRHRQPFSGSCCSIKKMQLKLSPPDRASKPEARAAQSARITQKRSYFCGNTLFNSRGSH